MSKRHCDHFFLSGMKEMLAASWIRLHYFTALIFTIKHNHVIKQSIGGLSGVRVSLT